MSANCFEISVGSSSRVEVGIKNNPRSLAAERRSDAASHLQRNIGRSSVETFPTAGFMNAKAYEYQKNNVSAASCSVSPSSCGRSTVRPQYRLIIRGRVRAYLGFDNSRQTLRIRWSVARRATSSSSAYPLRNRRSASCATTGGSHSGSIGVSSIGTTSRAIGQPFLQARSQ